MNQKDLMNDTLDKVIELNEPIPYTQKKKAIIYCAKNPESKIGAAIAYRMIEKYYGLLFINIVENGFENSNPPDLWEYSYFAMIGVSPNDTGMRIIRSMIHDRNIIWIDNQLRNIPMWTEYSMLPGERNPDYSLVELAWRFYHDMNEPPDTIKLPVFDRSVIEMSKLI